MYAVTSLTQAANPVFESRRTVFRSWSNGRTAASKKPVSTCSQLYIMNNTVVNYWKYCDGWRYLPEIIRKEWVYEYDPTHCGWFCWVYPAKDFDLEAWMVENMKDVYDCTFRFNGGNCMFTVWIRNKNDAALFADQFNLSL